MSDPGAHTPTATPDALKARALLLADVREFFARRGVLEVETPVLSAAGNSDPGINQFSSDSMGQRWLRTSPEYAMKRLLAAGSGDIYELGRVFRQGESGRYHNPEFTLLEWYRQGIDHHALMDEVAELINYCGRRYDRAWVSTRVSYRDWFSSATGLDPLKVPLSDLMQCARHHDIDLVGENPPNRDGWLDLLVSQVVQPGNSHTQITEVELYPASQAALARLHEPDRRLAERFEVFIGPTELANGYHELIDADEQRARFEAENQERREKGETAVLLDENLLRALKTGLPPCSGVALGVDRLLMVILGADHIHEVLAFPHNRA